MARIETVVQDIRFGARLLRRTPLFTVISVASLALGLGVSVALFTVLNGALLRPLPGHDTAELQEIFTSSRSGSPFEATSFRDFQSLTPETALFAAACATTRVSGNLDVGGQVETLAGALMSGGCFDTFNVRPAAGRVLAMSDEQTTDVPAVVLSYSRWVRSFDSDRDIVGRPATLNGVPVVVAGVAEPGFSGTSFDGGADFFVPPPLARAVLSADILFNRTDRLFDVYARLANGVTAEQAAARLQVIAEQLRQEDPAAWQDQQGRTRRVTILRELDARFATGGGIVELTVLVLAAIAGIVAIACVNLATMVLAKGAARTRELSVRLALGATRGRLIRQLATESILISLAGVALGLLVVGLGLKLFNAYRPTGIPSVSLVVDWRVLTFAAMAAAIAPIFFGAAPAAHALRLAIAEGLKSAPIAMRRPWLRLNINAREVLLGVQLTVVVGLAVLAGLVARSAGAGWTIGAGGDDRSEIAVLPVDYGSATLDANGRRARYREIVDTVRAVPGVTGAATASVVPLTGSYLGVYFGNAADVSEREVVDANSVSPEYFAMTGVRLLTGRGFSEADVDGAPRVVIVSDSLARRTWPNQNPVGRIAHIDGEPHQIIGVAADVPYRSLSDTTHPVLYVAAAQMSRRATRFIVHITSPTAETTIREVERALRASDPRLALGAAQPLPAYLDELLMPARLTGWAGAAAALLQLGLALMATWGLIAYGVQRRAREFAIRRALGATDASIVGMAMRPVLRLVAGGAIAGTALGAIAAAVMQSQFTGLAPVEYWLVVPAVLAVTAIAILGAWLPARRASAISAAVAMKAE